MPTITGDKGAVDRFRDLILKRLSEMASEDRAAVIELLQILDSNDCEEPGEVREAITELLFPESLLEGPAIEEVDDATKRRVEGYRKEVGREIRKARRAAHLTQEQLASAARLPQSHISRLEQGKHVPTYLTIERLAEALGVRSIDLDPGFEDGPAS